MSSERFFEELDRKNEPSFPGAPEKESSETLSEGSLEEASFEGGERIDGGAPQDPLRYGAFRKKKTKERSEQCAACRQGKPCSFAGTKFACVPVGSKARWTFSERDAPCFRLEENPEKE
jgi:hypothetical protein